MQTTQQFCKVSAVQTVSRSAGGRAEACIVNLGFLEVGAAMQSIAFGFLEGGAFGIQSRASFHDSGQHDRSSLLWGSDAMSRLIPDPLFGYLILG